MPTHNLYLYRIRPIRPEMLLQGTTADEEAIISEHFEYLKQLEKDGVVLIAGRTLNTDPTSFGIVILKAGCEEAARGIMLNDPAVKRQVMQAELFPFRIALGLGYDRQNDPA